MPDPLLTPDPLTTRSARTLLDPPEGSTSLEVLAEITVLKARLELFEGQVVLAARTEGKTWAQIGDVLGMRRQHAHRKWRAMQPRRISGGAVLDKGPDA